MQGACVAYAIINSSKLKPSSFVVIMTGLIMPRASVTNASMRRKKNKRALDYIKVALEGQARDIAAKIIALFYSSDIENDRFIVKLQDRVCVDLKDKVGILSHY